MKTLIITTSIALIIASGCSNKPEIDKNITDNSNQLSTNDNRLQNFLRYSKCDFEPAGTAKETPIGAEWQKNYYCREKRIYCQIFSFNNQKKAIAYGETFINRMEKNQKSNSRNSQIELTYGYTVNGGLLFILRGDDRNIINSFLSYFSGEE